MGFLAGNRRSALVGFLCTRKQTPPHQAHASSGDEELLRKSAGAMLHHSLLERMIYQN